MSWQNLKPKNTVSQETMEALAPVLMGQRLFNQGRYAEAEATYFQALEGYPSKSAGTVLVCNKLGILYEKTGDSGRALDIYEKGVSEGALTPFTYQRLCCILLEANRLDQALGYARKGIEALKKAHTNLPQEIYFWFIFQKLRWKIRCRMASSPLVR